MANPEKPRARASRDGKSLEPISPRTTEAPTPPASGPDSISDDIRSQWADTRMNGDHFSLIDSEGKEIATVPYSEDNQRHYMGGPDGNTAAEEARHLTSLNEQRLAQGKLELTSLEQIEVEEDEARAARRRERKNFPYSEKDEDRIKHNLRQEMASRVLNEEQRTAIEAMIIGVRDSNSARAVIDRLKTMPLVAGAGGDRPRGSRSRERTENASAPSSETKETTPPPERAPAPEVVSKTAEALTAKQQMLSARVEKLLAEHRISAEHKKALDDAIGSVKYIQELGKLEYDIATYEKWVPIPLNPEQVGRERKIENIVKQVIGNIDANPKQDPKRAYEAGLRQVDLADRDAFNQLLNAVEQQRGKRFGFIYETRRTPREARDAQRNELRETIANAGGTPPQEPPHEPPGGHATDAIRRSGGGHGESGHEEGHGHEKSKYAIDKGEYVGLKIMTVQEIIHDKTHQQFFGELLATIDPNAMEIQKRYLSGHGTQEDMTFMNYARYQYSKWDHAWSELTEHLSDTDVDMFIRRNQDMENIAGHIGKGRGKDILKNMLRYTAMHDPKTFEEIEHAIHEAHSVRDSYLGRRANAKMERLSEKLGIDRSEYEDFVDLSPEKYHVTKDRIEARLHSQAGSFGKGIDWLSSKTRLPLPGSSRKKMLGIMAQAEKARDGKLGFTGRKLENLEEHLQHASHSLSKVVGGEEVLAQVQRETITNTPHRPGMESGPETFAEAQAQASTVTPEALEKKITERIKNDPKWKDGNESYRDSVLSSMKSETQKSLKAGTGFWSWLVKTVFGSNFDKAARKAKAKEEHV